MPRRWRPRQFLLPEARSLHFPGTIGDLAMTSGDFNKDGIADFAMRECISILVGIFGERERCNNAGFQLRFCHPCDNQLSQHLWLRRTSITTASSISPCPLQALVLMGSIVVFLGKGDGTFAPPVSSNAPGSIWSLVTGNFNKDGRADLAGINASANSQMDQVVVFLGQGDGTFGAAQTYAAGAYATALAAGTSIKMDLPTLPLRMEAGINLLLGKGDGTFSPGANITFPSRDYLSIVARAWPRPISMETASWILVAGSCRKALRFCLDMVTERFGLPTTLSNRADFHNGVISSVTVGISMATEFPIYS